MMVFQRVIIDGVIHVGIKIWETEVMIIRKIYVDWEELIVWELKNI